MNCFRENPLFKKIIHKISGILTIKMSQSTPTDSLNQSCGAISENN